MKCVDIIKNTNSEGRLLFIYWHWDTKAWGANRIRYPSSPRSKRWSLDVRIDLKKFIFLKTYESLSESDKWSTWVVHSQGWNSKKLTGIRTSGGTCGLIRQYARNLTWTRMPLTVAEMWFSFETKCKVLHGRRQLVPWGVRLSPVTSATLMFSYQRVMAGTLDKLPV